MHRAHLETVPFENLDISRKRRITIDEATFVRKVVEENFRTVALTRPRQTRMLVFLFLSAHPYDFGRNHSDPTAFTAQLWVSLG